MRKQISFPILLEYLPALGLNQMFENNLASLVVEGLDQQTIAKLRSRAAHHQRSLEDEAKLILQQASPLSDDGLMPLRSHRQHLPKIAARLRALRQQIGWQDVPIRSLIEEGRRF